jgi:glycosyltransferase involved in cell wall biosynthesis
MRLAYDVTSLLDVRTGVGAFAREVLARVAQLDDIDVVGYSVSWRGRGALADESLPPGVALSTRPMAARPLRELWRRADWPPLTWWTGRVDVVHGPNFVVPPAAGAAELMTIHDLTCVRHPELCTRDTLQYPAIIRRAFRRGAHAHVVSQFVADEVIDVFAVDPEFVHVVYNGVDAVRVGDAARGRKRAGGERYVLALGTVEPRKDLPLLVDAFDAIAMFDADVRLVVAGQDGWGAEALTGAIARARHRDRVVRTGWVDGSTRADLLAGASVFAYPSRYEGFGLSPLEAMAVGVPVVTTTAGALPEILGDAALLVPPGDETALVGALSTALNDESVRLDLVARGRARVGAYSWDACAAGVAGLYRTLC